jgi:hypothetical protein
MWGVGCDCVAFVAAEPAPSSVNANWDGHAEAAAGAAAFAAALEKNSSLQTLNIESELFDFDIVCRDLMILIELFWGVVIVVLFCGVGMGVGCDCVACVAAEPAPSSAWSVVGTAAIAAAFAAALEKNSSLQTLKFSSELFDFDIVCRDLMILIELFWGVVIVVCFVAWAWAWVAIVLLVSLLNLRHHQGTPWAMLELLR